MAIRPDADLSALYSRPKGPGAIGVPAFAAQGDVLDAHAVNFARRALDKPEVVFTVEM